MGEQADHVLHYLPQRRTWKGGEVALVPPPAVSHIVLQRVLPHHDLPLHVWQPVPCSRTPGPRAGPKKFFHLFHSPQAVGAGCPGTSTGANTAQTHVIHTT